MACECPKQEMLFGFPKYDVESAADALTRAQELEDAKPALYEAALKLIERRQRMGAAIIKASKRKGD